MKKYYFFVFALLFGFNLISAQTASLDATLSLKSIDNSYIPYQNGMPVPSFEKQDRQTINLKGVWKKQRFAANDNISLAKETNTDMQI